MTTANVKNALQSVNAEITKAQHTLEQELKVYDAYVPLQPQRRKHLDTAQAHERAGRGFSQLTESIQNIMNEIKSELGVAVNDLGNDLGSEVDSLI
jgi:hypothetical protein